jgi:D-alanyl-D-alanine dipeptidase
MKKITYIFLIGLILNACKSKNVISDINKSAECNNLSEFYFQTIDNKIKDTAFVNLKNYSSDFVYDMKYATTDNFLKTKVYDCAVCFLRLKTVKSLLKANKMAMKLGYKIKLYDCYRPLDIQKKMWAIVPDANYVANPLKGSVHNKGNAVDITLVDFEGKEIDMGTEFDFFGKEASHNYEFLSDKIKSNRKLLKKIMNNAHFNALESEWWHYNLKDGLNDKVSNFKWRCD